MIYFLKVSISAIIVVLVAELSKRSPLLGGLLASLPIVSYLGIIMLYIDTKDVSKVSELSLSIFWLVLPTLIFFIIFPLFLKRFSFPISIVSATIVMFVFYSVMISFLKKYGFSL